MERLLLPLRMRLKISENVSTPVMLIVTGFLSFIYKKNLIININNTFPTREIKNSTI